MRRLEVLYRRFCIRGDWRSAQRAKFLRRISARRSNRRGNLGDGLQTAALADCERVRTNRRRANLRQPKKRLELLFC